MDTSVCVDQKGIVEEVYDNRVKVRIQPESACGACDARGICSMFGSTERIVEATNTSRHVSPGDHVHVSISRSMGNKAVLLGYLVPFILLVTVLAIFTSLGVKEWIAGIVSLGSLVPYFLILYFFRNRLNRTITFSLK